MGNNRKYASHEDLQECKGDLKEIRGWLFKFLTNDWPHLDGRVGKIEGKEKLLIGLVIALLGAFFSGIALLMLGLPGG